MPYSEYKEEQDESYQGKHRIPNGVCQNVLLAATQ
jgi:hypothetical protein